MRTPLRATALHPLVTLSPTVVIRGRRGRARACQRTLTSQLARKASELSASKGHTRQRAENALPMLRWSTRFLHATQHNTAHGVTPLIVFATFLLFCRTRWSLALDAAPAGHPPTSPPLSTL